MRKHSARKWLHFVLDLLPILVLPIFAIYEINHDHNTPIEVEVSVNKVVDFNQIALMTSGNVVNTSSDVSFQVADNYLHFYGTATSTAYVDFYSSTQSKVTFRLLNNHTYYFKSNLPSDTTGFFQFPYGSAMYSKSLVTWTRNNSNSYLQFRVTSGVTYDIETSIQLFDLTQMFGYGNEPSITEFDTWYDEIYYPYTLSRVELLENVSTVTYDSTDIGSQMMYALYKPVKDYFNFNNVFNFGDIYHWFELNMFGGNAPMPIFIVWNIIVYQFLMDLMFLVYSIFMFIIDFTSECLERCFSFSRHGGSR